MATGDLITQGDFKDRIRNKLRETIMDLVPEEALNQMIDKEINEFFHTDQLLTVKQTTVEIANPQYEPSRGYSHGNDKTVKRDAMAFGSRMTPFRQLVWSEVPQWLQPKVKALLDTEKNTATAELNKWFSDQVVPNVTVSYKTMFSNMTTGMAGTMMNRMMVEAVTVSHQNMINALGSVGFNTSSMPPPFIPATRV